MRCQELLMEGGYLVVVGGFSAYGLCLGSYYYDDGGQDWVAALRKF